MSHRLSSRLASRGSSYRDQESIMLSAAKIPFRHRSTVASGVTASSAHQQPSLSLTALRQGVSSGSLCLSVPTGFQRVRDGASCSGYASSPAGSIRSRSSGVLSPSSRTASGVLRTRAHTASSVDAVPPPPEGVEWLAQLLSVDAAKNPHFTLWQVGPAVVAQIAGAFATACLLRDLFEWLATKAEQRVEAEFMIDAENIADEQTVTARLSNTAISYLSAAFALEKTTNLFLPLAWLFSVYKFADFVEDVMFANGVNLPDCLSANMAEALVNAYQFEQWFFMRAGAIFCIVMTACFATGFKDRAVDLYLKRASSMQERFTGLMKMMRPLSSIATGVFWVMAVLNAALVCGLDVGKYMLAVGSVSGLAVGIGAQSLISSILSGVNLFLTVPFLVGDRVELRSDGATVLVGVVEGLKLCSTVFRLDSGLPVEVPNSSLTSMMICNQSRTKEAEEVHSNGYQEARALSMSVTVELAQDSEKRVAKQIPTLVEAIEKYLHRLEDVDEDMPINCTLEKFSGSKTATLKTLVYSSGDADYDEFLMKVMIGVATVVENNNCICQDLVPASQS